MIPKRVLIPPDKPTSLPKEIQKPIQTDWDSPSSYTGTVKRRPPSIESPKTPILYDVSNDKQTIASNIIQISNDDKISPQEVTQGNDISVQKRKGNKLSERKRHISNESESTVSTSDQIESKPISSTLRRKSKLKLPSSGANQKGNLLPSTSTTTSTTTTTLNVIVSKSNLPKLSQAKKACVERPKYTQLASSQPVEKEKEKQKSNLSKALQVNRNVVTTATTDIVESKQVKNHFANGELNKTRYKRSIRDGTVLNKTSYFSQPETRRFQTFTELYRDFPANYASTTVDRNFSAEPPPYCNPPSPTAPSSTTIYKQKNVLIETQKKIRFDDEDESLQHNHHIVVDTTVFGVDCFTQQNANDSQHLRNKFTLPKLEHSPKRSGNRSFTSLLLSSPADDCETSYKKFDKRDILRANANDYVIFNPTKRNFTKMNYEKTPSNDILAKPEFSSSVFKNIPVRPRKGIPHLENYCLFDPSTDFVNEKENKKIEINDDDLLEVDESELIEEIIYEDQEIIGVTSDDCDLNNYCGRIDSTSDEATTSSGQSNVDNIVDSVIDLTNVDINDDDDDEEINDTVEPIVSQSILNEKPSQNQSHRPGGGVTQKKLSTQNDKSYRHSSLPTSTSSKLIRHKYDESFLHQSNKFTENVGIENQIEVNLSPSKSSTSEAMSHEQKDTLKQSVSSPQLQNVSYKYTNKALPLIESNYVLFYPAPVHSRNQYKIKPPRPISTHSDADSGFLSPATPDGSTDVKFNPSILVLQQCDSIQGYIEVRIYLYFMFSMKLVSLNSFKKPRVFNAF